MIKVSLSHLLDACVVAKCRTGQPLNEVYGQDVLFVANDWHAALLPLLLTARFRPYGVYANARCCLAIHNLAHQGSHEAGR
jgi:starch synthase